MKFRTIILATAIVAAGVATACSGGGSKKPVTTPTPAIPGPVETLGTWVLTNRNVDFVGDCAPGRRSKPLIR